MKTVINGMTFDGATKDVVQEAVRDSLINFMAASAQAQGEATKEAQRAGIAHAKGAEDGRYKGRKPSYTRKQMETVSDLLSHGTGISSIAATTGLSRQAIYRIKDDPAGAESALTAWGL